MSRATSLGFGRYRAVLSLPGIRPLLAAAFVGRLPVAMVSLTIVLLVSQESGSYATAGAVSATQAMASAIFSPFLGRLIDRLGQTPVLVGRLAPAGTLTEAFTWETTAVVAGFAGGGALSGVLVESAGVSEALIASSALAGVAAAIAWIARSRLTNEKSGNG